VTEAVEFRRVVPILRIFDVGKAKDFYAGFLGFTVDWEHRFDDRAPVYLQVSRDGLVLHLSEHHGDGTPGSALFVQMSGLDGFHAEIHARGHGFMRPGIEDAPWNARVMEVIDPFGNRIRFSEGKG
jgi:catechol 2,3-dioxygenase-like lactoylglutathione lyase family enzyme